MAIATLLRMAFESSANFNRQVEGVVRETSIYRSGQLVPGDEKTEDLRRKYSALVREPSGFGFVPTIVADNAWNLTFDVWATDPEAQKPVIEAAVQAAWALLTGIEPPA